MISRPKFESFPEHRHRLVESALHQQVLTGFGKSGRGFLRHAFFEIAFSQLDPQVSVLPIEIRYFAQDLQPLLSRARLMVSIRYGQVMGARFND